MKLNIGRPQIEDTREIENMFRETIHDTFVKEGLLPMFKEDLENEIQAKIQALRLDFQTNGQEEYFLIAKIKQQIAGSIAYGKPNPIILDHLQVNLGYPEIKHVYILPKFQNHGIGTKLLKHLANQLNQEEIDFFYLDSGFKMAQQFWIKMLGTPICTLANYWGPNAHHMIWKHASRI